MARYSRLKVLRTILEDGCVPLFCHDDREIACSVVETLAGAGCRVVEFTDRCAAASDVFAGLEGLRSSSRTSVILGIGSVRDVWTAAHYVRSGADFIVGPTFDSQVAKFCNQHKVPYLPGCTTPTEIVQAERHGCEIVKIFPGASAGGPDFVRAVRGPLPHVRLMPTGGVGIDEASLRPWFEAGAQAVGLGSQLISRRTIDDRDWAGLRTRVEETMSIIQGLNAAVRGTV